MYCTSKFNFYNLFVSESDSLVLVTQKPFPCYAYQRESFVTLEYKGNLALITKNQDPLWFYLTLDPYDKNVQNWSRHRMHLFEVVICGSTYNDTVYILGKFYVFMKNKTH